MRGWLPDGRADVYALGVMLFEMLTGLRPDGPAAQALPWLREITPDLASDLEPMLTRALASDPQRRYATVGELMADLQPILARYLRSRKAPSPVLLSPGAPTPQPLPPPISITPVLEGIPSISMPAPLPMPTFDWEAFSRTMIRVPMPEPLPLPEVTAEGIEWPAVSTAIFERPGRAARDGRPEESPRPPTPQPQRPPVPARRAHQPVTPAGQPAPRPQPATGPRLLTGRLVRSVLFFLTVLLLLVLVCCCWFVIAVVWSSTGSTPISYHSSLNGVGLAGPSTVVVALEAFPRRALGLQGELDR